MSDSQKNREAEDAIPRAKIRPRKLKFSIVWIVPVVAGLVAGYLIYQRVREFGPTITIWFRDVSGLKIGQTSIQYRGVVVGEVKAIKLSPDQKFAVVEARLKRFASSIARDQSVFWMVRPEVGIASITGLGTIVAGPHIEVFPGEGKPRKEFLGLESAPLFPERDGLKIILLSSHLGSLKEGSPVYYRGIEVGAVQNCRLRTNASTVEIELFIRQRYAELVRDGSKFWNVSGVDMKIGLFRGARISLESLRSLVAGGVAFATPAASIGRPVGNGTVFLLDEDPKKEWLEWNPEILIPPEDSALGSSFPVKSGASRTPPF